MPLLTREFLLRVWIDRIDLDAIDLAFSGHAVERQIVGLENQLNRRVQVQVCVHFLGTLLLLSGHVPDRVLHGHLDTPVIRLHRRLIFNIELAAAFVGGRAPSINMKPHGGVDTATFDDDALHPHHHHAGEHLLALARNRAPRKGH